MPWFHPIKIFLTNSNYPDPSNLANKRTLRRLVYHFFLSGETLYKMPHAGNVNVCGYHRGKQNNEQNSGMWSPHEHIYAS